MKFWPVESGFVHVKDCLTRDKAERQGDIEREYPHFDAEDLKTIENHPDEQVRALLPLLVSGRAREETPE
jgi:hypothetical protein